MMTWPTDLPLITPQFCSKHGIRMTPTTHQNAAVWLRDRLLKARLDATLDTTVLSKRRM